MSSNSRARVSTSIERFTNSIFVGCRTSEEMTALTPSTQLRLYYRQHTVSDFTDIPVHLPLYLAYQSNQEAMYHFRVFREDGRWSVEGVAGQDFADLESLIQFYRDWQSPHPTRENEWESFPVWKQELACFRFC